MGLNREKNGTYETLNKKRIMRSTFRALGSVRAKRETWREARCRVLRSIAMNVFGKNRGHWKSAYMELDRAFKTHHTNKQTTEQTNEWATATTKTSIESILPSTNAHTHTPFAMVDVWAHYIFFSHSLFAYFHSVFFIVLCGERAFIGVRELFSFAIFIFIHTPKVVNSQLKRHTI